MTLKEAYHYQNFLDGLLYGSYALLRNTGFITTTKRRHKIREAVGDLPDKEDVVKKEFAVEASPEEVINLAVKALGEKKKLSDAISAAKAGTGMDIDSEIAMNKKYREFADVMKRMASVKPTESETRGEGYRINATSGAQEMFAYTIERVTTIDYPRGEVKGLAKKYSRISDEVSAKVDLLELTTQVDYEPPDGWDASQSFEDIAEAS